MFSAVPKRTSHVVANIEVVMIMVMLIGEMMTMIFVDMKLGAKVKFVTDIKEVVRKMVVL